MDIRSLIRKEVRGLKAYHVEDMDMRIKLDAMENPYALPDDIRAEIADALSHIPLNRYPDPEARELKAALSDYIGVPEKNLLLGNGSDELISMVVAAFGNSDGTVAHFDPSFAMYPIIARSQGQSVTTIPLGPDFDIDFDATLRLLMEQRPNIIFAAYPNNPTGNLFDPDKMRRLVEGFMGVAVVDEAYHSFASESMVSRIDELKNLIILRTLSKVGLAGLRLGIMAAHEDTIAEVNKVRLPYNINSLSQAAAVIVLRHRDVIDRQVADIISERGRLSGGLAAIDGVAVYPSATNFILFRVPEASRIFDGLKEKGILIKNLDADGPLKDCLRVTVGTPEENEEFLAEFGGLVV
jgi:histidinol-phosphate aminotransferase